MDGVSRGFDIYDRRTDASLCSVWAYYTTDTIGGGVRYGVPLTEVDNLGFGLGVESTRLRRRCDQPISVPGIRQYVRPDGNTVDSGRRRLGCATTRDSALYPTKGTLIRAGWRRGTARRNAEILQDSTQQQQWYFPLSRTYTLMLNGEIGVADGSAGKPLPFFKNFYAGGVGSVRGYECASLGPRDSTDAMPGRQQAPDRQCGILVSDAGTWRTTNRCA